MLQQIFNYCFTFLAGISAGLLLTLYIHSKKNTPHDSDKDDDADIIESNSRYIVS